MILTLHDVAMSQCINNYYVYNIPITPYNTPMILTPYDEVMS